MEGKIEKNALYWIWKLTKIYFKEVLEMTGTETFAVLSTEDLDQVLGGGMVWAVDDTNWTSPNAYSLAGEGITLASQMDRYRYGLRSW